MFFGQQKIFHSLHAEQFLCADEPQLKHTLGRYNQSYFLASDSIDTHSCQ